MYTKAVGKCTWHTCILWQKQNKTAQLQVYYKVLNHISIGDVEFKVTIIVNADS